MRLVYLSDQWDNRCRRRQQLAARLASSDLFGGTLYVESPLTWLSWARYMMGGADADARSRWQRRRTQGKLFRRDRITVLTPCTPLPFSFALHPSGDERLLAELLPYVGSQNESVVWVSHPFWQACARRLRASARIYDRTEDFAAFPGLSGKQRARIREADLWLCRNSDLVIVQTEEHRAQLSSVAGRIYCLPNGVDAEAFSRAAREVPPNDLQCAPRPILGYVGSVGHRIDWELVAAVAEVFPNGTLVFAGRPDHVPHELRSLRNVRFIGERPYEELPYIISAFDVGLIPYHPASFYGSPSKLFDYFAAGKPVVSTDFSGARDFSGLAEVARDRDDFVERIRIVLREKDPMRRQNRLDAAKEASWDRRGEKAIQLVKEALAQRSVCGAAGEYAG